MKDHDKEIRKSSLICVISMVIAIAAQYTMPYLIMEDEPFNYSMVKDLEWDITTFISMFTAMAVISLILSLARLGIGSILFGLLTGGSSALEAIELSMTMRHYKRMEIEITPGLMIPLAIICSLVFIVFAFSLTINKFKKKRSLKKAQNAQ